MRKQIFKPLLTTAVALSLISCMSLSACADEPTPTSDAAIPESTTVSDTTDVVTEPDFFITTDKDSYAVNEDINVSVKYINRNRGNLENGVLLSASLSERMKVKDNTDLNAYKPTLNTDESMSLDFVAVVSDDSNKGNNNDNNSGNNNNNNNNNNAPGNNTNNNNNNNNNTNANTIGSNSNGKTVNTGSELYGTIALYATLAAMLVLIVALRKNKKAVKMMSMLLCAGIVMSVSTVSFSADNEQSAVGGTLLHTEKTVTVDSKPYTIHAYLNIGTPEQPAVKPEPEVPDNFNEVIYSSNIAEYNGTIYCTRDVPNSGFVTVPTNLSEDISSYSGHYSFQPYGIAFYNDRLYISYKSIGSGTNKSKLYSCNVDGSDKIELASNVVFDDYNTADRSIYINFIIYKGVLYSNDGEFKFVIDDNADKNPDINIKDTLSNYARFGNRSDYYNSTYIACNGGIYYIENNSTHNTLIMEKSGEINRVTFPVWVSSIQRITDTKAYLTGYENDNYNGFLYEVDIETGIWREIDSHVSAGGGDVYFNW